MSKRPFLKADRWAALLAMPKDEEGLLQYMTMDFEDLDIIRTRWRRHRVGLALQL